MKNSALMNYLHTPIQHIKKDLILRITKPCQIIYVCTNVNNLGFYSYIVASPFVKPLIV